MAWWDTVKRLASMVVPGQFDKGIGVSCDDNVKLERLPTPEETEEAMIKTRALYKVRSDIGRFEVVGFAGVGEGTKYQLRHILTGEVFNVTKKMMALLFEKDDKDE